MWPIVWHDEASFGFNGDLPLDSHYADQDRPTVVQPRCGHVDVLRILMDWPYPDGLALSAAVPPQPQGPLAADVPKFLRVKLADKTVETIREGDRREYTALGIRLARISRDEF